MKYRVHLPMNMSAKHESLVTVRGRFSLSSSVHFGVISLSVLDKEESEQDPFAFPSVFDDGREQRRDKRSAEEVRNEVVMRRTAVFIVHFSV